MNLICLQYKKRAILSPVFCIVLFSIKPDYLFYRFFANRAKMLCHIAFHPAVDKRAVNAFA